MCTRTWPPDMIAISLHKLCMYVSHDDKNSIDIEECFYECILRQCYMYVYLHDSP